MPGMEIYASHHKDLAKYRLCGKSVFLYIRYTDSGQIVFTCIHPSYISRYEDYIAKGGKIEDIVWGPDTMMKKDYEYAAFFEDDDNLITT